jgi:hypothetical protein
MCHESCYPSCSGLSYYCSYTELSQSDHYEGHHDRRTPLWVHSAVTEELWLYLELIMVKPLLPSGCYFP